MRFVMLALAGAMLYMIHLQYLLLRRFGLTTGRRFCVRQGAV
jgi:hypothetical protein